VTTASTARSTNPGRETRRQRQTVTRFRVVAAGETQAAALSVRLGAPSANLAGDSVPLVAGVGDRHQVPGVVWRGRVSVGQADESRWYDRAEGEQVSVDLVVPGETTRSPDS
jgi:hypothetical protein